MRDHLTGAVALLEWAEMACEMYAAFGLVDDRAEPYPLGVPGRVSYETCERACRRMEQLAGKLVRRREFRHFEREPYANPDGTMTPARELSYDYAAQVLILYRDGREHARKPVLHADFEALRGQWGNAATTPSSYEHAIQQAERARAGAAR